MNSAQQLAALIAIRQRQSIIRDCLSGNPYPSSAWIQRATKDSEDLEGAYAAIETVE